MRDAVREVRGGEEPPLVVENWLGDTASFGDEGADGDLRARRSPGLLPGRAPHRRGHPRGDEGLRAFAALAL